MDRLKDKFLLLDVGRTLFWNYTNPVTVISSSFGIDRELVKQFLFTNPDAWLHLKDFIVEHAKYIVKGVVSTVQRLEKNQLKQSRMVHSAKEFLSMLDESGINYGFLSNTNALFLLAFLEEVGHKRPMFASCDIGIAKPSLLLYEVAIQAIGVDPKNIVMIGDSLKNDMVPAIELGMKTIWILDEHPFAFKSIYKAYSTCNSPNRVVPFVGSITPEMLIGLF